MLSVTSLFNNECQKTIPSSPAVRFYLGVTDHSDHVIKYAAIKRRIDRLSAGDMTIGLANHLQEYNGIINTPEDYFYQSAKQGELKVGFSDGVGGEDLMTLYEGNFIGASYDKAKCSIKCQDTIEVFLKQKIGNVNSPVNFYAVNCFENNPADMLAYAINSYSDLDFGTVVNCAAWAAWRNECGSRQYMMRGQSDGNDIKTIIENISKLTNTAMAVEQGKLYPSIMSITTSAETYDDSNIFDYKFNVDADRMDNHIEAYCTVLGGVAKIYRSEQNSLSMATYFRHDKLIDEADMYYSWFVTHPVFNIFWDHLGKYSLPVKELTIDVGMMGYKHQLNDRVYVSLAVASLDNEKFRIEGISTTPKIGKVKLDLIEDKIIKYAASFGNFYTQTGSISIDGINAWHDMNPSGYINGAVCSYHAFFPGQEVLLSPTANTGSAISRNVIETPADPMQWIKHNICKVTTGTYNPLTYIGNQDFSVFADLVYYHLDGDIYARDDAALVSTGVAFDPDKGEEIKCELDFSTQRWSIFVDNMSVAKINCMTIQNSIGDIAQWRMYIQKTRGDAILDNLIISNFDPDKGV